MAIKLTLPYPPSTNRIFRIGKHGGYLSKEARLFKNEVKKLWEAAGKPRMPNDEPIAITLRLYRPRKAGDASNRIKIVEDGLNRLAYQDDKLVTKIVVERYNDKDNPRVEIEITPSPLPL